MMGITHLVVGGTAASLFLQSSDSSILLTGAIASLLPDIDISTSPAGRVFPWVARWFEKRFPHRSCTHSLVASGVMALFSYPAAIYFSLPLELIHALNIGFSFGWFADAFTRNGVEIFWPSPIRCVCPGNRNFRLKTGSQVEYGVLVFLVAIALMIFNINASGGLLTQFNRLMASTNGVEQIYNKHGSNHLMIAHIKGVRSSDRTPISGDFYIIQQQGTGFLVQSKTGEIYKAGSDPDSQILTNKITADPGPIATTTIEPLTLNEEPIGQFLVPFNRAGAMVYISGQLTIDDPESLQLTTDPYQFPTIRTTANSITLESAPLGMVYQALGEQFATGSLSIRSIYVNAQTSPSINSQSEQKKVN